MSLRVRIEHETVVWFGDRFGVTFQRTLRVPDDGRTYPLPPSLGVFPVLRVEDYADAVPAAWRERGGVFIPLYQREALWLGFRSAEWKPNAVKVGVGGVNAVTGGPWRVALSEAEQDYLVCPPQLWLDGIKSETGHVRQFVAAPLDEGLTVESQVTGADEFGGMQLVVYDPRAGLFPDEPPPKLITPTGPMRSGGFGGPRPSAQAAPQQGIAAGALIEQKVYPDPYGVEQWDEESRGQLWVHLVNTEQFRDITKREPPPPVVTPQVYAEYGLPWFALDDEEAADVSAGQSLARVKSVAQLKAERGEDPDPADATVEVADEKILHLAPREPPREADAEGDDAPAEPGGERPRRTTPEGS